MTDYQTPTTELEAVNEMLRVIGESPVNALESEEPLAPDVDTALRKLRAVSREVQSRGWHFNTEIEYPLSLASSGELPLPANTLRVDTTGCSADVDVVQRGNRLYDRTNHTFTFTKSLKAGLVLLLPFEELPEAARNYITTRAARQFQAGAVGSATLAQFTEVDEVTALALLQDAEGDTADFNILTGTQDMLDITWRL